MARGSHLGTEPLELAPVRREALQHIRVASSGGVTEQVDRTPQDMAGVVSIAVGKVKRIPRASTVGAVSELMSSMWFAKLKTVV